MDLPKYVNNLLTTEQKDIENERLQNTKETLNYLLKNFPTKSFKPITIHPASKNDVRTEITQGIIKLANYFVISLNEIELHDDDDILQMIFKYFGDLHCVRELLYKYEVREIESFKRDIEDVCLPYLSQMRMLITKTIDMFKNSNDLMDNLDEIEKAFQNETN